MLGDPDVAVETFRGGTPSLLIAAEDHSGLGATRLQLTTCYRGNPGIARQMQRGETVPEFEAAL